MSLVVRSSKKIDLLSTGFWAKVERIFGEIPELLRMILAHNGFDSYLALKGIMWDDKKYFFQALEESITGLAELSDDDSLKVNFKNVLLAHNQRLENFKLKLGHKNLIINLCHELQKTNLEEFNNTPGFQTTTIQTIPDQNLSRMSEVVVVKRKLPDDEHGYSREDEKPKIKFAKLENSTRHYIQERDHQELPESSSSTEIYEDEQQQVQYIYEDEDMESEYVDDGTEVVEYHEVIEEDVDNDAIYSAEQVVKQEADTYEHNDEFDENFSPYQLETSHSNIVTIKSSKKPKHMYADEFLQAQNTIGRIGTPGRRRPKIQKNYASSEEGLHERWIDLVRQSCQVIVPHELLSKYDLSNVELTKIQPSIWEVNCPLCSKKIRLQLTHEGKYLNFKRSNFERHLRIVHYKQILKCKPCEGNEQDEGENLNN